MPGITRCQIYDVAPIGRYLLEMSRVQCPEASGAWHGGIFRLFFLRFRHEMTKPIIVRGRG
jgi:hypothetical protein